MKKKFLNVIISSIIIAAFGVFVIDYFSHLLFSKPMETLGYFLAKATLYFIFSVIFLLVFRLKNNQFIKVLGAGVVVALIWGAYYNILPLIFDYYPFGIALNGLTFLNMKLFGSGLAFGVVHTLAFVGGYYVSKFVIKNNH